MSQKWEDLVMAHYQVRPELIQPSLPNDLEVDTFGGQAWFSVVAFRLTNLCIRPLTFYDGLISGRLTCVPMCVIGREIVVFGSTLWIRQIFSGLLEQDYFMVFVTILPASTDQNRVRSKNDLSRKSGQNCKFRIEAEWENADRIINEPGSLDNFLLERYRFWARRNLADSSSSAFVRHIPYEGVRVNKITYQGGLFASQGFPEPIERPELGHYCSGFTVEATAPEWAFLFPATQTIDRFLLVIFVFRKRSL